MKPINIIFPMAGDGIRFGGTFKPLLDATEKKFIELAKQPFDILKAAYDVRYIFVYREDQELDFGVKEKIMKLFPNDTLIFCILPSKTAGPVDTIQQAIQNLSLSGEAFTCDCDHSVNIEPMYSLLQEPLESSPDILIPVWNYKEYEAKEFGKVKIDLSGEILSFAEKELIPPSSEYTVMGVIGCYYWKHIEIITGFKGHENFSEFMIQFKDKAKIVPVEIKEANFFGTPERLHEFRFQQAKQMTFFIDIDGTLIVQSKSIMYDPKDVIVLPSTREKITQWKREGHRIILTTGRETPRKERLEKLLEALEIPYDELITGCNSGTRVLINDKKPYCPIHKMAIAFQLQRNVGIGNINIPHTPDIIKILKGASFATVYLIQKNNKQVVRKYIQKTQTNTIHVNNLKHQLFELRRFSYMSPGSVPAILEEYESQDEYYFDIEYLENYIQLSNVDNETLQHVLPIVLRKLKTDIYTYKKEIHGNEWMTGYLNEKILPRLDQIAAYGPIFNSLINDKSIKINDIEIKGLRYFFESEQVFQFSPTELSPIHGDLTLENIMYNISTKDFKFIDQGGARYFDPYQIDLGKIFQTVISRYETWDLYENIYSENNGEFFLPQDFIEFNINDFKYILDEFSSESEVLFKQSVFFLSTHLIRLVPFMIKKSTDKSIFALLLALAYLYKIM